MFPTQLFVLEMANNHMGDINHGLRIVSEFGSVCRKFPEFKFAFKLQYRDLDTFIHPAMKKRDDIKYIKRFSETRLTPSEFEGLVACMREEGFLTMATPFDNASVSTISKQKLDFLKIASCSFTDWPLLEEVVKTDLPLIASTAGADIEDIDRVVSFFAHREKNFAIMHCVGEYPTADDKMHLSQIDYLKQRYPGVKIGFSTHESPGNLDIIKIAVAKGASIFEKHVGVPTDKYELNAYSCDPAQYEKWLDSARYSLKLCGVGESRLPVNSNERVGLRSLRRGVFVRRDIEPGHLLNQDDIYFAFPPEDEQFTANDWSKYAQFQTINKITKDTSVNYTNTKINDERNKIQEIAQKVKAIINANKITIPGGVGMEISHHYGLDKFEQYGLVLLTVVNRGYCKKLLVSLPGQQHPEQYHEKKEETFLVLYGDVHMLLNGEKRICYPGDVINIEAGVRHAFSSPNGSIIEEISSTHFKDDSYYTDHSIMSNKNRKTLLTYWMDVQEKGQF
jgi:sialic acid synthase SpsE/mannose-6-phosphate isomerase-like protein (cupin superfamily)